jgi:hypothetical protein
MRRAPPKERILVSTVIIIKINYAMIINYDHDYAT